MYYIKCIIYIYISANKLAHLFLLDYLITLESCNLYFIWFSAVIINNNSLINKSTFYRLKYFIANESNNKEFLILNFQKGLSKN